MHTIAIIGGGLSGTLVASQILRRSPTGFKVLMIERRAPVGRGVAYGTTCDDHLLNVPAARMSAFPDAPDHFVRWLAARQATVGSGAPAAPGDFLPRRIFGEYLHSVLVEARRAAPSGVQFEVIEGEAVDLEELGGHGRLTLADGRMFDAHQVVLALGNLPGEYPIARPLPFYRSPRYVHIPWQDGALDGIGPYDDVLLVGAGLTAVDVMLQLDRLGHRGVVHAVSRHGLHPLAHRPGQPAYEDFLKHAPLPTTILSTWRRVRTEVRRAAARGVDWRAVVDAIRPQTQALWQGFSREERARFMRHARPFWEAHRHRFAPQVATAVTRLERAGRIKFYAGRLQSLCDTEGGAAALFRRRGSETLIPLRIAKVINCTGPRTDYSKYQHPLLINLLARGLIDHDRLALGLNALPTGQVLRYGAGPVGWLFTLGAPLKGVLWESSAVPEIREQAQALARRLVTALPAPVALHS
jgi:uncharacterized NAD(P)/FAD-binding protein YdhS